MGTPCLEKHYQNGKLPRHLWKGSFWWRDNLKLPDKFKFLDGSTCFFWTDLLGGQVQSQAYLELFSFAKINRWVSKRPQVWNLVIGCSICHFQRKPLHKWACSKIFLLTKLWALMWTGEVTFGKVVPFSPQVKLTGILVMHKYITFFSGHGIRAVKISTRFSFGFYSKTAWVQGTFLGGK